ncbi:MAG: sigma-70 family RNA polymerase sigma factor [Chloroflexi bacterium]|nr:sigma-70 family RNA polymerase sigma factor [Chloroflexota bacterium]
MNQDNDSLWVQRTLAGDPQAFGELVQRYERDVFNLAYRMLNNANDAEDAAQETFLRAYSQLKTFHADRKFATWLLSICAHHCIDRLRRRKFLWLSLEDDVLEESVASDVPEPDDVVLRAENAHEIAQSLERLSPAYRLVVVLKYWHDQSVEEIARTTGDSVSAVKVKLHRARKALARAMTADNRQQTAAVSGQRSAVSQGASL